MSLTTLLLEIVLALAGARGLLRGRDWVLGVALVGGLTGCAVSLAGFIRTERVFWLAPWDLLLAPATLAVSIAAFPRLVPPVLRARLWSAPANLDRELSAVLQELGDILNGRPSPDDRRQFETWVEDASARGSAVLIRLERQRAASGEWGALIDAYIALTRRLVAAIPSGVTAEEREMLSDEGDRLARKYEALRAASRR